MCIKGGLACNFWVEHLHQCFSKCGLQANSISITWKHIRNSNSWPPPQTYWNNFGGEAWWSVLSSPPRDSQVEGPLLHTNKVFLIIYWFWLWSRTLAREKERSCCAGRGGLSAQEWQRYWVFLKVLKQQKHKLCKITPLLWSWQTKGITLSIYEK